MTKEHVKPNKGRPSMPPKAPDPTFLPDYVATQKDLKQLRTDLRNDMMNINHEFRSDIKSDLKWFIGGLYALITIGFLALGVLISLIK